MIKWLTHDKGVLVEHWIFYVFNWLLIHCTIKVQYFYRTEAYLFLTFSYKIVLCQYFLFYITPNVVFVFSYTKTSMHVLQFILR